jgi:hypothetical protein
MTEIAETIFDPNEAEARAKLLLRLASQPGAQEALRRRGARELPLRHPSKEALAH